MKTSTTRFPSTTAYLASGLVMLLLIGTLLWSSCSKPVRKTTTVFVLWDITDSIKPVPGAAHILPLFGLSENPNNGAVFRFRFANDKSLNPETVFTLLPAEGELLVNQFDRKREVEKFNTEVTEFLDSLPSDTAIGREQSSLFVAVAEAANRLAADTTPGRKIMLVYSDLREHTPVISLYNKQTLALLKSNPDKVQDMFLALAPLHDLSEMEVYLLYEPTDIQDDSAYRLISGLYKTMLEQQGAKVIISANITQ